MANMHDWSQSVATAKCFVYIAIFTGFSEHLGQDMRSTQCSAQYTIFILQKKRDFGL